MANKYTSSIADNPRVLVLTGTLRNVEKQIAIFEDSNAAVLDRHIAILSQNANKALTLYAPLSNPDFMLHDIKPFEQYVRDGEGRAFGLYLIGKDGGLKHEWSEITSFDDIANIIDQMPMRQNEARQ